jgi:hypothetical protein
MAKIDFKKVLKHLYNPSKKVFSIVDVPTMKFLMFDGHGDPNTSPEYQAAVETLYALAYKIKFMMKGQGLDYVVPPLEGLWWVEDMTEFSVERKDEWDWTMMIMQPDEVTMGVVEAAGDAVAVSKDLLNLSQVRFERFHEGAAAQIMYIGAYAEEGPTIARLHDFILSEGYQLSGKHHEIYLSDPRRTAPEKLKTVIRQPMT